MENSKNRVIKFRAWDGEEMDYEPKVWGDSAYGDPIGTDINKLVKEYVGVLMQFTGLKDKNGKEIYEGDIYRHLSWEIDKNGDEYKVWNGPAVIENIQYFFEDKGYSEGELMETYDSEHLEVIGNIYENPELLK